MTGSSETDPRLPPQMILAREKEEGYGRCAKPRFQEEGRFHSRCFEVAHSKKPASFSEPSPIEATPLASLPPEFSRPPAHDTSNVHPAEMILKLPEGFGLSRSLGHWPYLERLMLPGPRSSLEKRTSKELSDLDAEHAFESLQISLLLRERLAQLEDEVCRRQSEKKDLLRQLDAEMKEKVKLREEAGSIRNSLKESEMQMAQVLEANNSLTAENKALKEKKANLSKALTDAAACSSWEMKITCIKEFNEGKHLSWDLEEEERLFAESFPEKVDLGILSDFEIDALEDDDFSAAEEEEVQGGTCPDGGLAPAGGSTAQSAPETIPTPDAGVEHVFLD
ncbi:uncharacterized protein LOC141629335 [Silene latifolia]|uniref:uncharacterized protein LOC141629335 n=1 Tax=Silene latifolia TaxID=37657 RepID=UPI003D777A31